MTKGKGFPPDCTCKPSRVKPDARVWSPLCPAHGWKSDWFKNMPNRNRPYGWREEE